MLTDAAVAVMLVFVVFVTGIIVLLYGMRKKRFICKMAGMLLSSIAGSFMILGTVQGRTQPEEDLVQEVGKQEMPEEAQAFCQKEVSREVSGEASGKVLVAGVHEKLWEKPYGILLAFDDYSADTWSDAFDLFEEYNAHVTFFVNTSEPTEFCEDAIERGHEIGIHTAHHAKMTEVSAEEFYTEAIEPLVTFREKGYEITSFAYPYGEYDDWMNEELLEYYRTTRGAWYYRGYCKGDIDGNFIESFSIDNIHYETDEQFREDMQARLDALAACDKGTVVSLFSHAIDRDGDWCISKERLRILFEEAQKRNIGFYTFQELQKYVPTFSRGL